MIRGAERGGAGGRVRGGPGVAYVLDGVADGWPLGGGESEGTWLTFKGTWRPYHVHAEMLDRALYSHDQRESALGGAMSTSTPQPPGYSRV